MIGHSTVSSGFPGTTNTSSGDISIASANTISVTGGNAAFEAFAQIGHGGFNPSGDLSGDITIASANTLSIAGGTGSQTYAQLGHGAAVIGDVRVISPAVFDPVTGDLLFPEIVQPNEGDGTRSGDISVILTGELSLQDGPNPASNFHYAWLGHATATDGAISNANVTISASGIDMDAGSALASGADGALSMAILDNALSGGDVSITVQDAGLLLSAAPTLPGGSDVAQNNAHDLTLQASHDLTIGTGVGLANTGAGNIVLAAGQNFHNDSGSLAPISTGSGRWAVYSTRPDLNRNDIEISNADFILYGQSFAPADPLPATLPAGNGLIYAVTPDVTLTAPDGAATYGDAVIFPQATIQVQVAGVDVTPADFGFEPVDTALTLSAGVLGSFSTGGFINVGTYTGGVEVIPLFAATGISGQTVTTVSGDLVVTPRMLTVTATGNDKIYDGTVLAGVNLGSDSLAGDLVTLSGAASFDDKNVGTGKLITVTGITLSGADAGNYVVASSSAQTTADITPATLTVTAASPDKIYDGTTQSSASFSDDRIAGDSFSISGTASFEDRNVGTDKLISVTGITLTGADAGNYVVALPVQTTADITPATLTVILSDQSKPFDGTGYSLPPGFSGFVSGDDASVVDQSGVMILGDRITVGSTTVSATGFAAQNYVFDISDTATLIIFGSDTSPGRGRAGDRRPPDTPTPRRARIGHDLPRL